jgi:hypothetical protein
MGRRRLVARLGADIALPDLLVDRRPATGGGTSVVPAARGSRIWPVLRAIAGDDAGITN